MMRLQYLFVAVIFGTWVVSLFWGHSPQPDWSMNAEVGSLLAAIVCTLVALFSGRRRAFGLALSATSQCRIGRFPPPIFNTR
jgi:hypothetical protein